MTIGIFKYKVCNCKDRNIPIIGHYKSISDRDLWKRVLIDPLNIELIADTLDARKGISITFPKDDSERN